MSTPGPREGHRAGDERIPMLPFRSPRPRVEDFEIVDLATLTGAQIPVDKGVLKY